MKRLIEVAIPLFDVSEQAAREKNIRHGHLSTLHIWWARRPLAACRAVVFGCLIPDPDDAECPESFRTLVMDVLGKPQFSPTNGDDGTIEDTARNRCLEFVKHLVRWANSTKPEYIEPARKLLIAAHKILNPESDCDVPRILDPFSGGGAIPLEALRLGCEANAFDLNPVAHLLQLCTLRYPQEHGQPTEGPVPNYIVRAIASKRDRNSPGQTELFGSSEENTIDDDEIIPEVSISERDYRENPLASDVRYWGHWVLETARRRIGELYPNASDGSRPLAYIWANTLVCPNPSCRADVPLIKQLTLSSSSRRSWHVRMKSDDKQHQVSIEVCRGKSPGSGIEYTPTIVQGAMRCPVCEQGVYDKNEIKVAAKEHGLGTVPVCVVSEHGERGREYREFQPQDIDAFDRAKVLQQELWNDTAKMNAIPDEKISRDFEWVLKPPMFGLNRWCDIFNERQQVDLATLAKIISGLPEQLSHHHNSDYALAVQTYIALALDRHADYNSKCQSWDNSRESIGHTFGRQAIAMSWDYCESNPFSGASGDFAGQIDWIVRVIKANSFSVKSNAVVRRGSATRLPIESGLLDAVITDPPYYDAVPYSDLSDFFYVWLKRSMNGQYPELFRTPVTPKTEELVEQSAKVTPAEKRKKTRGFFEDGMGGAMSEAARALGENGIAAVMFAHKTTSAWEQLIAGLLKAGFIVTASWPFHTELKNRLRGIGSAALASSVTLICRKRASNAGDGIWDDVRSELKEVAAERLDFFWGQGIRGADFFISAIGPALSVFGRYSQVIRLSGEPVGVGEFLDEVRGIVTGYALTKILQTTHTSAIDPESRFYVVWKWSYGDAKVPADESFKLAQALGMDTDDIWNKSGVLAKSGENVQSVSVDKRIKVKDLGEPRSDGVPASAGIASQS